MPDKLQREIEDLLARLDTFPPPRPLWKRALDAVSDALRRFAATVRVPALSAGHVLLLGIALIVIAYVALPDTSDITRWLIVAGIVIFIGAFVFSLRRQSRPPEKLWRGKPMDLHDPGAGERVRSWWDRWRGRR